MTFTLTLTLKSSPKVKIFETYLLRKTSLNILGYYAQGIIYSWQGQGEGQAKCQIPLIGYRYNFGSKCHRDFKLGSYFSLRKAVPYMTLTLNSLPKVKILETPIKEN